MQVDEDVRWFHLHHLKHWLARSELRHKIADAIRIIPPYNFTDSILVVDGTAHAEKTFGTFSTDASVAYLRHDKSNKLQTLVIANATKFSDGTQSLLTGSVPITLQVSYASDTLSKDGANLPTAQLRVSAQNTTRVMLNGNAISARREQIDFVIDLR